MSSQNIQFGKKCLLRTCRKISSLPLDESVEIFYDVVSEYQEKQEDDMLIVGLEIL